MRKPLLLASLFLLASTAYAAEKHQSYISYSSGQNVIVQGDDGVETEARVNVPIFPGDEFRTDHHGRAEVRLSDGNVLSLNRDTSIRLKSASEAYEGSDQGTVAQLLTGHVIVERTGNEAAAMRLDTDAASYVSSDDGAYSIEVSRRGTDIVQVFEGSLEVRTQARTARLRSEDRATVDADGPYGIETISRHSLSEFEQWSLRRADRAAGRSSRYLDSRLSYADEDLDDNGSWVYVNDYNNWCWRPRVASSWRPYTSGYWDHSPYGTLVWVSNEPWGWVPYHYGRWSYVSSFGWVWAPGSGYSPAWVYWAFGLDYVGWAPAGWYDCFRPYYGWAYDPYSRAGLDFGFGFNGHVRLGNIDLHPWTFVNPGILLSRNTSRAALTTDEIRNRLARNGGDAAVSGGAIRLDRNGLKDPGAAVRTLSRRGLGVRGTGKEGSGTTTDMTPFFRRDPELSSTIRDRVVRPGASSGGSTSATPAGSIHDRVARDGSPAALPRTNEPRIDGGRTGRDGSAGGRVARPGGGTASNGRDPSSGRIGRETPATPSPVSRPSGESERGRIHRDPAPSPRSSSSDWRSIDRSPAAPPRENVVRPERAPSGDQWRRGTVRRDDGHSRSGEGSGSDRPASIQPRDIPRHVIDQIGGARITPTERVRPSTERESARAERPRVERAEPRPRTESHQEPAHESHGRIKRN